MKSTSHWADRDRPDYRIASNGKSALSNRELLSLILQTGTKDHNAFDLVKVVLSKFRNLNGLKKCSMSELEATGITTKMAARIVASFELATRERQEACHDYIRIINSRRIFRLMQFLCDLDHEEFWVIFLNKINRVLRYERISLGGMDGTVADSRIIFRRALELKCVSIVLCHNHPSGSLKPSDADIKLTRRMKDAGAILEIDVIDHVILAQKAYYSFADEGIL